MEETKRTDILDLVGPLLRRLNLLEYDGKKLSWTNVAVAVCVVKIAIAPEVTVPELGALLLSLANYGHKRVESAKAVKVEASKLPQAQEVLEEVKAIQAKVEAQSLVIVEQQKILDEAKSALIANKLAASQTRRQL